MIIHSLHTSRSPTSAWTPRSVREQPTSWGTGPAIWRPWCWNFAHENIMENPWKARGRQWDNHGEKNIYGKPVENTMESHPTEAKGLEKVMRVALSWVPTSTPAHNQTEVKTHLKPLEVWELLNVNTHLAYFHLSICSICMAVFLYCLLLSGSFAIAVSLSSFLACILSCFSRLLAFFLLSCFLAVLLSCFPVFLIFFVVFLLFPFLPFDLLLCIYVPSFPQLSFRSFSLPAALSAYQILSIKLFAIWACLKIGYSMVPYHVQRQGSNFWTHPPFLDPKALFTSAKAPYWGWDFIRAVNRLPWTVRAPWGQAASMLKWSVRFSLVGWIRLIKNPEST